MREMSITVRIPGAREATYRFADPVVRVGRSETCHLSICHEAVPRDLCLAWLEDNGRSVRVEERPGLSNPLMRGRRPVQGGVAGKWVEVSVGPVSIRFAPACDAAVETGGRSKRRLRLALTAATVLAVAALSAVVAWRPDQPSERVLASRLPSSPFGPPLDAACSDAADCNAKARLAVSRAREILNRPGRTDAAGVQAGPMLIRAARMLSRAGDPSAAAIEAEGREVEKHTLAAYRRETLVLARALEEGRREDAVVAARRLSPFLEDGPSQARAFLASLAGGKQGAGSISGGLP